MDQLTCHAKDADDDDADDDDDAADDVDKRSSGHYCSRSKTNEQNSR